MPFVVVDVVVAVVAAATAAPPAPPASVDDEQPIDFVFDFDNTSNYGRLSMINIVCGVIE